MLDTSDVDGHEGNVGDTPAEDAKASMYKYLVYAKLFVQYQQIRVVGKSVRVVF